MSRILLAAASVLDTTKMNACRRPGKARRSGTCYAGVGAGGSTAAADADRSMGRSAATSARSTTPPGLLRETGRATMSVPGRYDARAGLQSGPAKIARDGR